MDPLSVRDLKTYYYSFDGIVRAADGISFDLEIGKTLALCGESGSGKSTTALSILRLVPSPGRIVGGEILLDGTDLVRKNESEMRQIRWKKISMVFQGSMNALNPLHKIGDQIIEAIILHEHLSRNDARRRVEELLRLVGIEESRADNYPHEFSGGMKQRAMIAMALACHPSVLVADEPLTALDVMVSARTLDLIKELQTREKLSMLLITHDLSVVAEVCDRIACMYAGKIVELTDVISFFKNPVHPYSIGLLKSFPTIHGTRKMMTPIKGEPPDLIYLPSGCRFHPRCPYAKEVCRVKEPEIEDVDRDHYAACHFIGELQE